MRTERRELLRIILIESCQGMQAMNGGRGDEDFSAVKESLHVPQRPNVDTSVVN